MRVEGEGEIACSDMYCTHCMLCATMENMQMFVHTAELQCDQSCKLTLHRNLRS